MKPIALIVATTRWFPTVRLAIALAKAGFVVETVCPSGHPISKTSAANRIHTYHGLTPLNSFAAAIAKARPNLIVPGDDLARRQLHLLHQRERFKGKRQTQVSLLIERSLGTPDSYPCIFSRRSLMQIAEEENVLSPKTDVIASSDDLVSSAACADFPLVLKADGTSGGRGVRIVHSLEEAERAWRVLQSPPTLARASKRAFLDGDFTLLRPSLFRQKSVVNAQAFVQGREATSALACWKGNILAALNFEVIEKAQTLGHATVVRIVENKDMSVTAERIVRRLCLSGLIGLDFILNGKQKKPYLIEMNPRATQVGHLTLGAGRDLPAALYAAVSGEAVKPAPIVTENDTIALFPQEWIRDAGSPFLTSAHHDVPWEEPDLVSTCALRRRKQTKWYSSLRSSKTLHDGSLTSEQVSDQGNQTNLSVPSLSKRAVGGDLHPLTKSSYE
jgi:hypothetical protein